MKLRLTWAAGIVGLMVSWCGRELRLVCGRD